MDMFAAEPGAARSQLEAPRFRMLQLESKDYTMFCQHLVLEISCTNKKNEKEIYSSIVDVGATCTRVKMFVHCNFPDPGAQGLNGSGCSGSGPHGESSTQDLRKSGSRPRTFRSGELQPLK